MIGSINGYNSTENIWQQYSARQAESSDKVNESEEGVKGKKNPPPPPPPKKADGAEKSELTDSQNNDISALLEEYDVNTLTEEDAIEIMLAIEEIGVTDGRNLSKVMLENGFDAEKIKNLATRESSFPPDSIEMRQVIQNFKSLTSNEENKSLNFEDLLSGTNNSTDESILNLFEVDELEEEAV